VVGDESIHHDCHCLNLLISDKPCYDLCSVYSPTKLNIAALIRPTLSPKLSRPAASADNVIVKLSHERTRQ
jgi:hypothetical protein